MIRLPEPTPPASPPPPSVVLYQHADILAVLLDEEQCAMRAAEKTLYSYAKNASKADRGVLDMFFSEMRIVISTYLRLVRIQRALNNFNTNAINYPEGMLHKMLSILGQIPREEMSSEKHRTVCRDALFLYYLNVTRMAGPKHSKRLRTPDLQYNFCSALALLANDVPVANSKIASKATGLAQFASAMGHPAFQMAVHNISSVYNHTYSAYKECGLSREHLLKSNLVLGILSSHGTQLSDRKPRTLALSALAWGDPAASRALGLVQDDDASEVAAHLRERGVSDRSFGEAISLVCGSYDEEGMTLKIFGEEIRDLKIVSLSILAAEKLRAALRSL